MFTCSVHCVCYDVFVLNVQVYLVSVYMCVLCIGCVRAHEPCVLCECVLWMCVHTVCVLIECVQCVCVLWMCVHVGCVLCAVRCGIVYVYSNSMCVFNLNSIYISYFLNQIPISCTKRTLGVFRSTELWMP